MTNPVVHFEIIGQDPNALREYYAKLFGWESETSDVVSDKVAPPGGYGFVSEDVAGVNGGIGGGEGYAKKVLFYVGVEDVEQALRKAEQLGGTRVLGPEGNPGTLVIGQFTDPAGNLLGVAGTA